MSTSVSPPCYFLLLRDLWGHFQLLNFHATERGQGARKHIWSTFLLVLLAAKGWSNIWCEYIEYLCKPGLWAGDSLAWPPLKLGLPYQQGDSCTMTAVLSFSWHCCMIMVLQAVILCQVEWAKDAMLYQLTVWWGSQVTWTPLSTNLGDKTCSVPSSTPLLFSCKHHHQWFKLQQLH